MPSIDPVSNNAFATAGTAPTTSATNNDGLGKDTFLKLLVAQLKYQNPMSPADGTQFLAQTAQFTMVEKLNEISQLVKTTAAANEVLEAGSMIGKNVTIATQGGTPAVTTVSHIGGNLSNDTPLGAKVTTDSTLYTTKGTKIPVKLEFTKLADGADGSHHWSARAFVGTARIGSVFNVDFDASGERTSPDPKLTAADLDGIPGAKGLWDAGGVRVDFGTPTDNQRLRASNSASNVSSSSQNGTDGTTIAGVVTGTRFTINGPLLLIGGKEYSLGDVTEVRVAT